MTYDRASKYWPCIPTRNGQTDDTQRTEDPVQLLLMPGNIDDFAGLHAIIDGARGCRLGPVLPVVLSVRHSNVAIGSRAGAKHWEEVISTSVLATDAAKQQSACRFAALQPHLEAEIRCPRAAGPHDCGGGDMANEEGEPLLARYGVVWSPCSDLVSAASAREKDSPSHCHK